MPGCLARVPCPPPAATDTPDRTLALVPESVRTRRTAVAFDAGVLVRITRLAMVHPWRMGLGFAATLFAAAAQLVIPQLIGEAVDHAQSLLAAVADETEAREALFRAATLILVTSVLRGLFTMMQNYQGEAVGQLIGYHLRLALYAKLQSLSFSYHDRVHTGDLMTRGILDVEGVKLWVSTGLFRAMLLVILVGGGAWLLMSIDWVLGCVALSFVPFVAVGASLARLRLRHLWYALQEELAVLTRVMEENLGRHPGGARLRVPGLRAGPLRRHLPACARHRPPAHRRVREEHHDHDLRVLRLDGPGAVGGRREGDGGRADDRRAGRLSRVHGHPSDAGAPDRVDGERDRADVDLRRAPLRDSRPRSGRSGDRPGARDLEVRGRGGSLRERLLPLPQGGQGPAGGCAT